MSIKLKHVELSNIRSHKHITFNPESGGITAIRGVNGSGKSTIVDSIAWTLYGTKPAGVSKVSAIYRNGAVWGTDKCYAVVEIEIDGQLLKVERRMITKAGAVECDVWEVDIDDSGKETLRHVAGSAVSQVESYIRQRFKMDEKGFLAAILVQQKQVDNLISATAKERAQVIEKLTGISSITNALNAARQESNTLKKTASRSSADEETLNTMKEESANLQESVTNKQAVVKDSKEQAKTYRQESETLKTKLEEEEQKIADADDTREQITKLDARIESHEEALTSVIVEKDAKRATLSRIVTGTDIDELQEKLANFKKDLRSKELDLRVNESSVESLSEQLKVSLAIVDRSSIKELSDAESSLIKNEKYLVKGVTKKDETAALIISLQHDSDKIDKAIQVLDGGDGTCPTCLQHVDDVSDATRVLLEQKERILADKSNSEDVLTSVERNIVKVEDTIYKLKVLIEAFKSISSAQIKADALIAVQPGIKAGIVSDNAEIDAHEKLFNTAKRHEESKKEYDRLLNRAEKMSNEMELMKSKKQTLKKALVKGGTISPTALSQLRKKAFTSTEKTVQSSNTHIEAVGALSLLEEKLSNVSANIKRGEKELKAHKELLQSVEIAVSTTKVIEEFREDRIKNSIPVIEVYASDLLNRFTEGRFTQLKIDSKFNTTVILADGTERAVGLLSGGELSAAAMALRISISMLLNGASSKNLIILDEVLVSQDTNRSELILSTVKEICKGQVIIIAHSDSIDAIADNIVELTAQ